MVARGSVPIHRDAAEQSLAADGAHRASHIGFGNSGLVYALLLSGDHHETENYFDALIAGYAVARADCGCFAFSSMPPTHFLPGVMVGKNQHYENTVCCWCQRQRV